MNFWSKTIHLSICSIVTKKITFIVHFVIAIDSTETGTVRACFWDAYFLLTTVNFLFPFTQYFSLVK